MQKTSAKTISNENMDVILASSPVSGKASCSWPMSMTPSSKFFLLLNESPEDIHRLIQERPLVHPRTKSNFQ
jgi:hypothetical protein